MRKSEKSLGELPESPTDSILLVNPDGIILDTNQSFVQYTGRSVDQLIGSCVYDVLPPHLAQNRRARIEEVVQNGVPIHFEDVLSGIYLDHSVFPILDSKGKVAKVAMVDRDITRRRQIEKALQENEEKFRTVADFTYDWEYWEGKNSQIIYISPSCERISGYKPDEFLSNSALLKKIIYPSDAKIFDTHFEKVHSLENLHVIEDIDFRIIKKNGSVAHIGHLCRPVFDNKGNYLGRRISNREITERKLIEEALTQQNNALSMLNNFSIGLSKLSIDENLEAFIARWLKEITGAEAVVFAEYNYESRLLTYRHIEIEPGLLKKIDNLLGKQLNKSQSVVSNEMYREMTSEIIGIGRTLYEASFGAISRPVGTAIQTLLKVDRFIGQAYLVEGKLYGTSLLAMSKDRPDPPKKILESFSFLAAVSLRRKRAEQALQKSEEKWRKLITTIPDFIALHDLEGRYVFLNHYAGGFSEEYVIGKSLYDFISEDSKEDFRRNFDECLKKTQIQRFSYSGFGKGRSLRIYDGYLVPILENDIIVNVMAIAMDITERIRAETGLRESEARFRGLFENSLVGISLAHAGGGLFKVNNAYARMYGYETSGELLSLVHDTKVFFANPEERKEVLRILQTNGSMKAREFELIKRDGSHFFALVSACEIRDSDGQLLYSLATHLDFTNQKKMEEDLRNSKKTLEKLNQHLNEVRENERAAISREIHDRLGQSLTVLKIDLNWLSRKIEGESEEGIKLNEMIELVTATNMDVHRISSELRPAIFDDLGLAAALEWYCEEFENRTGLMLNMAIEDIQTGNSNKDLAIYRVAQESLTNIIRHAGAKKVQIKLHKTKKDIVLLIQDDGTGISPDKIRSTKSFGLLGMFERVNQSGGHMEITAPDKGGTRVRVYMPIE